MKSSLRLESIQILRGIAASMVVFHHLSAAVMDYAHSNSMIVQSGLGRLGASGVDIFFVISGFIMVYTTRSKNRAIDAVLFLKKRVLRIYPLYWIWTSVILFLWLAGIGLRSHSYGIKYIFESYMLLPVANGTDFHPLLDQGWTLSFEMLFYLMFACVLSLSYKKVRAPILLAMFVAAYAIGGHLPGDSGVRYLFSNPILFEFLYGAFAAELTFRIWGIEPRPKLLAVVPYSAFGVGIALLLANLYVPEAESTRCFNYGVPAFLIVLGAATWKAPNIHRGLVYLGNASYSIYLVHGLFSMALGMMLKRGARLVDNNPDIAIAVGTLITIWLTSLAYVAVEKPMMRFITRKA